MKLAAMLALAMACGHRDASPVAAKLGGSPCDVVVFATADGTWVGTRAGAHRFAARCGATPDLDAVSHELARLRDAAGECLVKSEVAAAPGTTYFDLLAAMDAVKRAGLPHAAVAPTDDLLAAFPATPADGDRAPAACPPPADAAPVEPRVMPRPPTYGDRMLGEHDMERVVVVWLDGTSINWQTPEGSAHGKVASAAELVRALPPPAKQPIVAVWAARDFSAPAIVSLARDLANAGYDDVRFSLAPE